MESLLKALKDDKSSNKQTIQSTIAFLAQPVDPHKVFNQQFTPPQQGFPIQQPQPVMNTSPVNRSQMVQPVQQPRQQTQKQQTQIQQPKQEPQKEHAETRQKQQIKKEPIESKHPEFVVFRLNNLEHRFEETINEFNEEMEQIKSRIAEVRGETQEELSKLRDSLAQTLKLIEDMNMALPEYIDNKINELKLPLDSLAREMEMRTSNLQQQIMFNKQNISNIESDILSITQHLDSLLATIGKLQEKISQIEEQVEVLSRVKADPLKVEVIGDPSLDPEIDFTFLTEYYDYTQSEEVEEGQEAPQETESPEAILEQALMEMNETPTEEELKSITEKLIDTYEKTTEAFIEEKEDDVHTTIETDLNKIQMAELIEELGGKKRLIFDL